MRYWFFIIMGLLTILFITQGCMPESVKKSIDMIRQANVKIAEEADTPIPEGEAPAIKLGKIKAISEDVELLMGPVQLYAEEPNEFIAYTPDAAEALSKTTKKAVQFRLMLRSWWDKAKSKFKGVGKAAAAASTGWGWVQTLWTALAGGGAITIEEILRRRNKNKKKE